MSPVERAEAWIHDDPDAASQAELRALVDAARQGDAKAAAELGERFAGPLEFGTAGLRGVLGAGESRMNLAVVRRTTYGLGRYLLSVPEADAKRRGVAIGYDGRRKSCAFAHEAAGVLAALGIPAHLSLDLCPTPMCAYATKALDAAAGIMVTASHNPPEYNGYKVYWGNGAQIIAPIDRGIAAAIAAAPPAREVPVAREDDARASGLLRPIERALEERYLEEVHALGVREGGDRSAPIVYTPLHGVGNRWVREALARAGFSEVTSVPEQAEPDGEFPTVAFPNPEEKGALDLAIALAEAKRADLILASDPDTDRLAVAVRKPDGRGFLQLSGNQVGVLLGHYLLTEGPSAHGADRLVVASCVSSPQLGAIAAQLGVKYEETLTGFKWIANRALELGRTRGLRFVFGYEEALGYTVGTLVRDKDGVSAALLFAELWAVRRAEGLTMLDELERIARSFGHYASRQLSVTLKGQEGLARIRAVMGALRERGPARVGPLAVVATRDLQRGVRRTHDGDESKLALPPSDVLVFELEGGSRIIARPSGTEPKLKVYFDVRETVAPTETLAEADARAQALLATLEADFARFAGLA